MKKITLLLAFIACVVFAQAQNLVVNPGFETWTDAATPAPSWLPTLAASQTFSQESTIVHSGTYSLKSAHLGTSGTAKMITKPYIVVTAGQAYTFSFWYYTDAATTNLTTALRMWGYWENPDGSNGTFDNLPLQPTAYIDLTSSVGSWKQFSVDITAPTGSGQLELDIRFYKSSTVYIDDVSLIAKSSGINTPSADVLNISLVGKKLSVSNATANTVEIFNTVGAKVQSSKLESGSVQLNDLSQGLYVVRVGKQTAKIVL